MKDQEMITKILLGDEKALRGFYEKNKSRLLYYIQKKVSNEKDAEELMYDAFLSTIDNLDHFLGKSSLFSFLCAIANHKVIDYYRKRKIKCLFFSQYPILETVIARLTLPEEEMEKAAISGKIEVVFNKILPKYRKIIQQKYLEGLSIKEIASINQWTIKKTESLLFRARAAFCKIYINE